MNFPFRFALGEAGVEVNIGSWNVRTVRYDDIAELRNGYPLWNEHWTNIWPFRYLTIRRKTGFIKNFVINPSDREAFADELRRRIA